MKPDIDTILYVSIAVVQAVQAVQHWSVAAVCGCVLAGLMVLKAKRSKGASDSNQ